MTYRTTTAWALGRTTETAAKTAAKTLGGLPVTLDTAEALRFPAGWLLDLPLPVTLGMHVPGVPGVVRASRSADALAAASEAGEVALDVEEWRALVAGTEADRVWPRDLVLICERKRAEPAWRLTGEEALDGAQPDPDEQWSLERALARLGVELVSLELE